MPPHRPLSEARRKLMHFNDILCASLAFNVVRCEMVAHHQALTRHAKIEGVASSHVK